MKFGLIGAKLGHSVSPQIHEILFKKLGIDRHNQYDLLEMERSDIATHLQTDCGYTGMNVTIPYKIDVMPFLKKISHAADRIGAVNTIHVTKEGLFGYNTDYVGFGRSLDHAGIKAKGNDCIVLGSGGAARAVIQYLADAGAAHITVVSRNPLLLKASFSDFAQRIGIEIIGYHELGNRKGAPLMVNCTPVGMYPNMQVCPISEKTAARYEALVDLIYNPKDTLFLQYGKRHGAITLNGMFMLVAQAVVSEEIWLERQIGNDVINSIAKEMENIL
ncbi:MAG: shikimate dehydrogenase [Megasphaera sp.]|jgi:shikimate dehydrogenase|uniref:shikimate dehydrogenase family protein n=1 Tax=Megasphaera sueciensis TaxID=349094 RepID=UPI003D07753C|nr:shikimate dehydrogenase [Megasphaera sp.]MCI1823908.1 shikimate dehydrogenase [Megasphaera sp.]